MKITTSVDSFKQNQKLLAQEDRDDPSRTVGHLP